MNRRGFLKSCLALAAAPAIVRAESLMKLWVPPQELDAFGRARISMLSEVFGAAEPFDLADGSYHRITIVRRWLGVDTIKYYVDDNEVSGIKGVKFDTVSNSVLLQPRGFGEGVGAEYMMPATPSRDVFFSTNMKVMPENHDLLISNPQFERITK